MIETDPSGEEQGRDLAYYVDRVPYPADQATVIATAARLNAPPEILEELGKLPAGASFESSHEAFEALGG